MNNISIIIFICSFFIGISILLASVIIYFAITESADKIIDAIKYNNNKY